MKILAGDPDAPPRATAARSTVASSGPAPAFTTAELGRWVTGLRHLVDSADDAERIDRIRVLEELKAAAAAAQARETAAFKASQLQVQLAAGIPARDVGRGIGAQVALARRESPHRGGRLVGLAEALVHEMPHTLASLEEGTISEWRATLLVKETACLSREDRTAVDAELSGRLGTMGNRQVEAEARRIAYRLDPHASAARSAKAAADRHVTLRPAPDTMSLLTGALPVAQGVAAFAALSAQADTARSAGDPRSRGQIMADTLVERLTGRASAPPEWAKAASSITWAGAQESPTAPDAEGSAPQGSGQAVEIRLVMTDQTLFGFGPLADEAAHLSGYGPIPAPLARLLASGQLGGGHGEQDVKVWLRRLYTHPATGALVAMESTRRVFEGGLRSFVTTRDRICRTPWCNAPIRHLDHPVPVEMGGATSGDNAQGLCEACNYAKQAPGWRARPSPEGAGQAVDIVTPTGHRYRSIPPLPPGQSPPHRPSEVRIHSPMEARLRRRLLVAYG